MCCCCRAPWQLRKKKKNSEEKEKKEELACGYPHQLLGAQQRLELADTRSSRQAAPHMHTPQAVRERKDIHGGVWALVGGKRKKRHDFTILLRAVRT